MKTKRNMKGKALGCCVAAVLAASMLGAVGCDSGDSPRQAQGSSEPQASSAASESGADVAAYADIDAMDLGFTDRDMDATYDEASATKISLSGNAATVDGSGASAESGLVTIEKEGTYVVSGDFEGQLLVDTTKETKLQVVLAGARISNPNGPAMYVKQADKCFVTLAEGSENSLSDGAEYAVEEGEDEPNATLFSKDDLTINGAGSLAVTGAYKHAIHSKDDLVITGGTFDVTSVNDALRGKDCLKIADGAFSLKSGEDAVKSSRDDDPALGYVLIEGGDFKIDAGDDAVHGETALFMNGGTLDVASCTEGLEAMVVTVNGGEASIVASDDALNASAPGSSASGLQAASPGNAGDRAGKPGSADPQSTQEGLYPANPGDGGGLPGTGKESCQLYINGGQLTIQASGDAIDSNGTIEINGGTVLVTGPTSEGNSAFDYDISATVNGGTVLMVGSSGMAQDFTGGTQPFLFAQVSGEAGQPVSVTDESGQELVSFVPAARYQVVQASCPQFIEGGSYRVVCGDSTEQVTASCTPSGKGMGARGFGHGGFGRGGDFPGTQGPGDGNGYDNGDGAGTGPGIDGGNPPDGGGNPYRDGHHGRGSGDGAGDGPGIGGGNGLHDGTHHFEPEDGGANVQSA